MSYPQLLSSAIALSSMFPALSPMIKGTRSSVPHPTLEDGWLAQRFTDAAYLSAERWTLDAGMIPASNVCLNKF